MELKRGKFDMASSGKVCADRSVSFANRLSLLFVPRSIGVLLGLMILFIIGLWMWSYSNDAALPILRISLQLLVIVVLVYFTFGRVFRASSEKNGAALEDQTWRRRFFWIAMGGMVLGALVLVVFVPTTASLELLKRFFSSANEPQFNDMDIRLSTSFMPAWAQIIFAGVRCFAAPYCLLDGGSRYISYYALFLAIILFLIDRRLMSSSLPVPLPLPVLSQFGVLDSHLSCSRNICDNSTAPIT